MKKSLLFLLAFVFIAGLATVSFSEDMDKDVKPCADDAKKFCAKIKPGQGRIWACLKSNEDRLSGTCSEHIAKKREEAKEFISACKDDAKKLCAKVRPGQGRKIKCLKKHEADLSEGCKAFFKKN